MASKGKGIATKDSSGKRKRGDDSNADKGGGQKRKNRSVLQFFEDAAAEFDGDGDSDSGSDDFFDDADFLDELNVDPKVKSEPGRFEQFPFFPKEEELSGDELEKMLAERYRSGSGFVRYAEDDSETKKSVDKSFLMPSSEPAIWKVKCKVGREKNTVFCLIQKYVDLKALGTKLQIISAFAVEHIKGFVFVEAERQADVTTACNQLADVYFSLVTQVPTNEVGQILAVRKRYNEVKEGTWARVKNGIYRGDLAQVVAVNNERKRATVKLIPRIDLQALTEKYGGGATLKRTKGSVPAARLISSSDLEEFRPLIQYRRDRDTGKMFEFLDSLMLKDGFLYKKISIDSLSFWAVNPTEDELQKFTIPSNDESDNLEWLSQLYGEEKKKCNMKIDKGGGKGEGSSGSHEQSSFEVHDLVHFGKRDFGMVVGMEKDENYKILKDYAEGPVTLTLGQKDLKYVPQDKKFTALDHRMKTISINDTVRILDGPTKGRQGIVKQVYRGVIFLYDENDLDNAYFCSKSQMSEKVKHSDTACHGKDEGGLSSFEDVPNSPKSPLSPKKPWQTRENDVDGDRTGKDGLFSVGQSLRIRIGPLKGYLCRVLAVRYSDVTVKLDSQQKVLTVKREHLSEVRGKSSTSLTRDDPESSSPFKPFDLLGSEGNTNNWLQQASGSADGDGWNVGGLSSERSSWPAFPSSSASLQVGATATGLSFAIDNDKKEEDTGWLSKVAVGKENTAGNSGQVGTWGTGDGVWEKEKAPSGDNGGSWNVSGCSSSQEKADNETDPWIAGRKVTTPANNWGSQSAEKGQPDSWDKGKRTEECGGSVTWAEPKLSTDAGQNSWGKAADGWGKKNISNESSEWRSSAAASQPHVVAAVETHTGWSQRQGQIESGGWKKSSDEQMQTSITDVHGSWAKSKDSGDKGSDASGEDSWGKLVHKCSNKDSSNTRNEWGSSTNKSGDDGKGWKNNSGGWSNSQEANAEACEKVSSGWKSSGDGGSGDSWSKTRGFGADGTSFDKTVGNDSWGQSKNFENDRGFTRGQGLSGRGRGRDQFGRGRGRGRSFDRGQSPGFNKDSGDSYSSGNKGWRDQPGSSWGNSSVENDGLTNSWDKGKSWNDNKGWNKSNEADKGGGGLSLENSSQAGWNGATPSSSSWGQKSWERGKGNDQDNKETCGAADPWGKAADASKNNSTSTQSWGGSWAGGQGNAGQTLEDNAMDGWKKGTPSTSDGWAKGGDVSQGKSWGKEHGSEGGESWNKPAGNNSWGRPRDSDNDQGHGFGGRRGGRGFRGGRDHSGRGGGGRPFGRGRFSGERNESQGNSFSRNNDGSSWGKGGWSADGGGDDRSCKKPGEGGSSWGGGSDDKPMGGWRKPNEGGSSWGGGSDTKSMGGDTSSWSKGWRNGAGGREGKGWDKPSEGGSWGGGSDNRSGDHSKGWSSGGGMEDKGWGKPNQGSSWGGASNNRTSGDEGTGWSSGGGAGVEGKGWRKPSESGSWKGNSSDETSGGNNLGSNKLSKGWGSGDGTAEKGWSKAGGGQGSSSWGGGGQGGSSWGGGSNNEKGGWDAGTSRNGRGSAGEGSSSLGEGGQGGSSWGGGGQGGSSWGGGSNNQKGGWDTGSSRNGQDSAGAGGGWAK